MTLLPDLDFIDSVYAERLIEALAQGGQPVHGNTIVFNRDFGWIFGTFIGISPDSFILAPEWYITEPIASSKPYGFRFYIDPGSDFLSIVVTYDPGTGEETYTYDVSAPEIHTLFLTDGTTPFITDHSQASFAISVVPYELAAAGGAVGTELNLVTGAPLESGRGMVVERQDGTTILTGNLVRPSAPFEFTPDAGDEEPILGLSITFGEGNQTGTWEPDYDDGPTQTVTLTGNLTVNDISNFPDGGTMNLHFILDGNTLTLSGTFFEGVTLVFSGSDFVAISIVDFGRAKLVAGGMSY